MINSHMRLVMKHFTQIMLLTLFIALLPLAIPAQTIMNLTIMAPNLGADVGQAEARLLEDSLVSGLLVTGAFNVTFDTWSRSEAFNPEKALERGTEAGVDFVLFLNLAAEGRLGSNRSYTMGFRLVAIDSKKELYARSVKFIQGRADVTLSDEAKRIATAARSRSDVTVDMIDALLRAREWESALRYLKILSNAKPALDKELIARYDTAQSGLAAQRFGQAKEAVSFRLFEEARRSIAEAQALDPKVEEYKSFAKTIEDEYARYLQEGDEARLKDIETFLDRGRLDVAQALFDRAGESARQSPRGKLLAAKLSRYQVARKAALAGESLFANERYPEALSKLDEAIQLHPDNVAYIRLRLRIIEAERRRAAVNERWAAYKEEVESFDFAALTIARRSALWGWRVNLDVFTISTLDPSQGSWMANEIGPFLAPSIGYTWALPWSMLGPLSFIELVSGAWAEIGLGSGVMRENSSISGAILAAQDNLLIWAAGGAEGRLEALSFALVSRVGLDLSYLGEKVEHRSINGDVVKTDSDYSVSGAASFRIGLEWAPARTWSLAMSWGSAWPVFSSLPINAGAPTRSSYRFSLGVLLP